MCYDVATLEFNSLRLAIHRASDAAEKEALLRKLDEVKPHIKPMYHLSGFTHPKMMVFTDARPLELSFFHWGLIPHWVKDEVTARSIMNKTLNARGETIFDKPSFKQSALQKRCIIYIDAFFEHHHFKKKTYPFRISMKDECPMALAGLWDEWLHETSGQMVHTFTIVTTKANSLMAKIHNNPALEDGPRMPVILPKEKQNDWLAPVNSEADKNKIIDLIIPLEETLLMAHTVGKLKGKEAVGNVPEVGKKVTYVELVEF